MYRRKITVGEGRRMNVRCLKASSPLYLYLLLSLLPLSLSSLSLLPPSLYLISPFPPPSLYLISPFSIPSSLPLSIFSLPPYLHFLLCLLRGSEEVMSITQDSMRNRIMTLNLLASGGAFAMSAGTMVTGIFGMKRRSVWEEER